MDDLVLKARIDDNTTLYVSPIDLTTYEEYIDEDVLGGSDGYFVMRQTHRPDRVFEVLAKAPSFEAAGEIFDMIVSSFSRERTAA